MDVDAPTELFGTADLEKIVPAAHMRVCITAARKKMEPHVKAGNELRDYFSTRFYGSNGTGDAKPLNLIAQTFRAYLPKLVPRKLIQSPRPKKAGLEMEAITVKHLLEQDDEEQRICEDVYEPMIAEACLYGMATSYATLRQGKSVNETPEADVDEGEPGIVHVEYAKHLVDPYADNFRSRLWEGHDFRVARRWLKASPAYQDPETLAIIDTLPAFEETPAGQAKLGGVGGTRDSALFDTIELVNVCVYDHTGIYEGTIAKDENGTARWLRASRWTGADGGPYDHLQFLKVPGMLIPIAIIMFSRDLAEMGDKLMRKLGESAANSKKVLGYTAGAEDEAEEIANAPHGGSVKMDDPDAAKIFDFNLMQAELGNMVQLIKQEWNDASGQANMISGGDTNDETLGQADIRAGQANDQVEFLKNKIGDLATSHSRKRVYWFMSKARPNYTAPMQWPGLDEPNQSEIVELSLTAENQIGRPEDYAFDCTPIMVASGNPELRASRVLQAVAVLGANMPLFQMGILKLGPTMRFLEKHIADGLSEIAGDDTMMIEQQLGQQGQEAFYASARGEQPAGPGGASNGGGAGVRMGQPSRTQPQTMQGARRQAVGQPGVPA